MAGRGREWLVVVAVAGTTVVAAGRWAPVVPPRDRPMAIHRPGTPNVGSARLDAADAAFKLDRYAETERLAREVLAARERTTGPDHPALARPLFLLALSLQARDRKEDALPPMRRALAIVERHPGPPHAKLVVPLHIRSWIALESGRGDEAEALAKRALAIADRGPGDDIRGRVTCLDYLSWLYHRQERPGEVEAIARRRHDLVAADAARSGLVEVGPDRFDLGPDATPAQKDARAAQVAAQAANLRAGGSTSPMFNDPGPLTNSGSGGISTFFTGGGVAAPEAGEKAERFPRFPSDLGVRKTSAEGPKTVLSPPSPE